MLYNLAHLLFFSATYAAILAQNETEISASEPENEVPTSTSFPKHIIINTTHASSEESEEMHFEHKDISYEDTQSTTSETFTSEKPIMQDVFTSEQPAISEAYSTELPTTPEIFSSEKPTTLEPTPEFVPDVKSVDTALQWPPPEPPGGESTNTTRVYDIDAECQNASMRIAITFNGSFNGLIYTTSYASDPACVYVNGTGAQRYDFFIYINKCGTFNGGPREKDLQKDEQKKKYMWNTLTVQYNQIIEESRDEHFEVTCEYGYDFWKTISFPVVQVEPISEKAGPGSPLHFPLSPPECYMEIKQGYSLTGPPIQGSVAVGDPLTLVIHMRSKITGFDVIINNCEAHDGGHKRLFLIDKNGCPVDEKLISEFRGKDFHGGVYETQVFAYFKAFRFTGSPALYLECNVRMCHGICPKQKCYWRRQKRSISYLTDTTVVSNDLKMMKLMDVRTDNLLNSKSSRIDETSRRLKI